MCGHYVRRSRRVGLKLGVIGEPHKKPGTGRELWEGGGNDTKDLLLWFMIKMWFSFLECEGWGFVWGRIFVGASVGVSRRVNVENNSREVARRGLLVDGRRGDYVVLVFQLCFTIMRLDYVANHLLTSEIRRILKSSGEVSKGKYDK